MLKGSSDLLMKCLLLGKKYFKSGVYIFVNEYFEIFINDIAE